MHSSQSMTTLHVIHFECAAHACMYEVRSPCMHDYDTHWQVFHAPESRKGTVQGHLQMVLRTGPGLPFPHRLADSFQVGLLL